MVYVIFFAADKNKEQNDQDKKSPEQGDQVVSKTASTPSEEKTQSKNENSESGQKNESGSDKVSSATAAGKDGGGNEKDQAVSGSTCVVPPGVYWLRSYHHKGGASSVTS